eukprot:12971737-Alexandrium_andersonii.AAC.1
MDAQRRATPVLARRPFHAVDMSDTPACRPAKGALTQRPPSRDAKLSVSSLAGDGTCKQAPMARRVVAWRHSLKVPTEGGTRMPPARRARFQPGMANLKVKWNWRPKAFSYSLPPAPPTLVFRPCSQQRPDA